VETFSEGGEPRRVDANATFPPHLKNPCDIVCVRAGAVSLVSKRRPVELLF